MKRMMIALALGASLVVSSAGLAATYDLSGEWNLSFTAVSNTGPCPAGRSFEGKAAIEQSGDSFTYRITEGTPCDPAFTCVFQGTVSGADYSGSNSGDSPDGGHIENTLQFTATSQTAAGGNGTSTYTLADMTCTWQSSFTLSRTSGTAGNGDGEDSGGCSAVPGDASGTGAAAVLLVLLVLGLVIARRR